MTVYRYVNGVPVTREELRIIAMRGNLFSGQVGTARHRCGKEEKGETTKAAGTENITACIDRRMMVQ